MKVAIKSMMITTLSTVMRIEGEVATLVPSRAARRIGTIGLVGIVLASLVFGTWLLIARPMAMAEGPSWFDTTFGVLAILFSLSLVVLKALGFDDSVWTIDRAKGSVMHNNREKARANDITAVAVHCAPPSDGASYWSVELEVTGSKPLRLSIEKDQADAKRLVTALANFLGVPLLMK